MTVFKIIGPLTTSQSGLRTTLEASPVVTRMRNRDRITALHDDFPPLENSSSFKPATLHDQVSRVRTRARCFGPLCQCLEGSDERLLKFLVWLGLHDAGH